MKILLAEDDHNVSVIIKLVLERIGGHQVVVANDGEKALSIALSQTFDLLILDGMMPKMSGLEVCRELRKRGQTKSPVVFLSAKTDEKDIAEFLKCGFEYIAKPFDPQTICQRIDEIMERLKKEAS